MRVTVDIPDILFARAKRLAEARRSTVRDLAIEGLEAILKRHPNERPMFRLKDESFGAGSLTDGLAETDWERIRDIAYQRRGG